ncbi:hypothetical protein MGYG_08921 [Nannizzia gypsea CBS 118893]|uniref:Uncharacterized protein n=1 Tax=Arthroderma gypseum (strain ATCC MYA-4604 / CBS 118893) TaxID=535722 RepID=E5QZB5_ARTGP|nr:hypothetical protein MGYG_08921 [Nannizzia gypsea CBS 118893]EFQ98133.1 hypothetical protein MGYG_08921 [Nannizzia gypsea CBS 118893]
MVKALSGQGDLGPVKMKIDGRCRVSRRGLKGIGRLGAGTHKMPLELLLGRGAIAADGVGRRMGVTWASYGSSIEASADGETRVDGLGVGLASRRRGKERERKGRGRGRRRS